MGIRLAKPVAISFRSIEQAELEEIHRRQNGADECKELSGWLDFDLPWAPMSLDQVKGKLDERRKEARTAFMAVYTRSGAFVGVAYYSAEWDPWCPFVNVFIWPEHRRKGYGTEAARMLLAKCFGESVAHVVSA